MVSQLSTPVFTPHDEDSIERPTILGAQLTNPYLIPNITQAYHNMGINNVTVNVTNLYVRFKPTVAQVYQLDSFMNVKGVDIFDEPMDYDIVSEGDYYQDPSIPDSLPTWQYAVVPPNFTPPAGITYQSLAQIHIPADNYSNVETEAERLAALHDGGGVSVIANGTVQPDGIECAAGYHKDPETGQCIPDNCPTGYHWQDGSGCVPNSCPAGYYWDDAAGGCTAIPTGPSPDSRIPAGKITVYDTQLSNSVAPADGVGVRNVRMIARRWFKTEHTYTDASGNFTFTKHFKHKVKVFVEFENGNASIRPIRAFALWKMLFPVRKKLGIFSGDKSAIAYHFVKFSDYRAKGNLNYAAATTLNAVEEYRDFATAQHIGLPPQSINIMLTRLNLGGGIASTPMFHKRSTTNLPGPYIQYHIAANPSLWSYLLQALGPKLDIIVGYMPQNNVNLLISDWLKETEYHELTHAAHYTALGTTWYTAFVNAEITEIVNTLTHAPSLQPYGPGNDIYAPQIALGESWAYYMGHFMADLKYGLKNSQPQVEQPGKSWYNDGSISANINVLEKFDPNYSGDPFKWIPQGLYEDLRDATNETFPIPDQVSGFTNQQMFAAFNSSVTTIQAYKSKLISLNPNNQTTQVTALFSQYHY